MDKPMQEKQKVNINSLKDIHLYLSGVKDGKGDLQPLGTIVLEDLMNAILYLRGDVRYTSDRDEQ